MSQRTNDEILERHEKGLPQYKSDERRLHYIIQAAYANKRAHALKAALEATHTEIKRAADSTTDPVVKRHLLELVSSLPPSNRGVDK